MKLTTGCYRTTVYVVISADLQGAQPTIHLKLQEKVVLNSVCDQDGRGFVKVEYLDLDRVRQYGFVALDVFLNCFEYVDDLDLGE